jgi:hypothetical protein
MSDLVLEAVPGMSDYEREGELVAYCGIYCRLCDYFTGEIRDSAQDLLAITEKHTELKLFAETSKAFDYDNFVEGLKWLSKEISPCVGGCKGGGGWKDCPFRKCCSEKGLSVCYECSEFPCETLEKHPERKEELTQISQLGLENWIKKRLDLS